MKRLVWAGLLTAACLLLLAGGFLFWLLHSLDGDRLRPLLERRVTEATGRALRIAGPLRFKLLPSASIIVDELRLESAAGASEPPMLVVPQATLRFRILPLFRGQYHIRQVSLYGPRLRLSAADSSGARLGKAGQPARAAGAGASADGAGQPSASRHAMPQIDAIDIHDGRLWLADDWLGRTVELTGIELTARGLGRQRPLQLSASGQVAGRAVSLEGVLGPLGHASGRSEIPLDVTLAVVQQARLRITGSLWRTGAEGGYALRAALESFSPRRLAEGLGLDPLPPTADPGALEHAAFSAAIQGDRQRLSLSQGQLELDGAVIALDLRADDLRQPVWRAALHGQRVDLGRYLPPPETRRSAALPPPAPVFVGRINAAGATETGRQAGAASRAAARPPQPEPDDNRQLREFKLQARVAIDQLVLGELTCHSLGADLSLNAGMLQLTGLRGQLCGGVLSGRAAADVVGKHADGELALELAGFDAGRLVQDLWRREVLAGRGDLSLELRCPDLHASDRVRQVAGRGQVLLRQGRWIGFDMTAMVRNSDRAFGLVRLGRGEAGTDFSELRVPLRLEAGKLLVEAARMDSPVGLMTVNGQIAMEERRLDLRAEPVIAAEVAGRDREIRVPVLITGTLDAPVFQPDLRSLAQQRLEQKLIESKTYRKAQRQADLKPLEQKAKELIRGLFD